MRIVIYQHGLKLHKFMAFAENMTNWKILFFRSGENMEKFALSDEILKVEMYPDQRLCKVYLKNLCREKIAKAG